jgi:hypothetical protein
MFAAAALTTFASAAWAEEQDKSGTNPAVLTRSAAISNEYRFLDDDNYYNILSMKYTEPFADGRMSVDLPEPLGPSTPILASG